jgi:hypothetical protein
VIVVIQCAAGKRANAGHLRTKDGRRVMFVAQPKSAPPVEGVHYARPDDLSDTEGSWRENLERYSADAGNNPLGLLSAAELYTNPTYEKLSRAMPPSRLYIMSAGWGILPENFRTPNYDITFSSAAESYKRRGKSDLYQDFILPDRGDEPMLFFGGKDYVPLFVSTTRSHKGPRTVFFNSKEAPAAAGCRLERYETSTRTNWHYECANAWLRSRAV